MTREVLSLVLTGLEEIRKKIYRGKVVFVDLPSKKNIKKPLEYPSIKIVKEPLNFRTEGCEYEPSVSSLVMEVRAFYVATRCPKNLEESCLL